MDKLTIVKEARSWEGVPFRHQGRSRFGVDCIGFPQMVMLGVGMILPKGFKDKVQYGPAPNNGEMKATIASYCTEIFAPEDGCLVLIKWPKSMFASHVGLIDGSYLIHAYQGLKKVSRVSYGQPWLRLTDSLFRLPGVDA